MKYFVSIKLDNLNFNYYCDTFVRESAS